MGGGLGTSGGLVTGPEAEENEVLLLSESLFQICLE